MSGTNDANANANQNAGDINDQVNTLLGEDNAQVVGV